MLIKNMFVWTSDFKPTSKIKCSKCLHQGRCSPTRTCLTGTDSHTQSLMLNYPLLCLDSNGSPEGTVVVEWNLLGIIHVSVKSENPGILLHSVGHTSGWTGIRPICQHYRDQLLTCITFIAQDETELSIRQS